MKKILLVSAVVAGLMLSGCGEKKSEETKKIQEPKKVEKVKEESKKVVSVKEKLQMPPMPPALPAAATFDAKSFFNQKCASCHGKDGKRKALGKSGTIAGMAKEELIKKLKGYKAGTLNSYGMGALMKAQVASLSNAQIEALAGYINSLK